MITNIRKKGNLYEGRYMLKGSRRSIYSPTKTDCFNKLSFLRGTEYLFGNTDSKYTLGEWLTEWLNTFKAPILSKSTITHYELIIRLHIPQTLKKLNMGLISAVELQKAIYSITLSKTREETYNTLNGAFSKAHKLNIIQTNPMINVDKPKHERKQGQALTAQELAKLLTDIDTHPMRTYFLFLLYTGARRREALDCKWEHIDIENKTIRLYGTKTKDSLRTIPLMPDLENILQKVPKTSDNLFDHTAEQVTKQFHKICQTHKLHDLRHTFATRCLQCGIPLKVVQEWLGHTSIKTTANIYTHLTDDFSQKQAKLFSLST